MAEVGVKSCEALKLRVSRLQDSGPGEALKRSEAVAKSFDGLAIEPVAERVAVEEPLEIRLGGRHFTLTMRTPGHDEELAAGFLLTEGFISSVDELGEIRRVRNKSGQPEPNAIDVVLSVRADDLRERLRRNFVISSSCGLCGKTSIESVRTRVTPITSTFKLNPVILAEMPVLMRAGQQVFSATGGLHAAALFQLSASAAAQATDQVVPVMDQAKLEVLREDIGRHNAVDKVLGYALMRRLLPLKQAALMVSGRLSFEIVQKAATAGIPIVAAVSAPSSLAVELAFEVGMTLIGFVREKSFNIYTHADRIAM